MVFIAAFRGAIIEDRGSSLYMCGMTQSHYHFLEVVLS